MTTITKLTKEQLIEEVKRKIAVAERYPDLDMARIEVEIFKIALASLEAKPVAWECGENIILFNPDTVEAYAKRAEISPKPLYAAPPVPVVPPAIEPDYEVIKAIIPTANPDEYACCIAADMWNACRAVMLQSKYRDLSQPVDPQISEYEKIMLQAGNSPVTPDGWISCSERMPNSKTGVLVAREFGRKGDWRMKWGTYIPGHPDAQDGWIIPGASWLPTHWMPLPAAPQQGTTNL